MDLLDIDWITPIKALCKKQGISLTALETKADLGSGIFSKWKKGVSKPSQTSLTKIANYFNMTFDQLAGNTEFYEHLNQKYPNAKEDVEKFESGTSIPVWETYEDIFSEYFSDAISWEEISSDLASKGQTNGFKISDDSMYPRFFKGDFAIILKQDSANTNDIVLIKIRNTYYIRKYIKANTEILLQAFNPSYDPIIVTNDELNDFKIIGKVMEVRAKLN